MPTVSSKSVIWSLVAFLSLGALCVVVFNGRPAPQRTPRQISQSVARAVAVVNGQPITHELWQQHAARRGPTGARAALDDLIRQELLFQHAKEAGYDRDPKLLANFRRMVVAKFEEEQLERRTAPLPTPEEARSFYEANLEKYRVPEKRRAAVLFVQMPRIASALKKAEFARRANSIREEALSSQSVPHFGALAAKYSDDQATRYTGGDLGWLAKGDAAPRFGPALTEALFALANAGDVSQVIEVPDGFCFIKLMERREASVRLLEEVREAIQYQLTQQRQQQAWRDFDQQLRARAEIQIDDDAIAAAAVAAKANEPKPPRMPSL